jgi:predicted membrane protein (TIGR00267 family)
MKKLIKEQLFALLLGLIDGILTVLVLATGHVLKHGETPITLSLSLKVAFATAVSGACIYFFSEYSRQRHRLIHAEKQLNLATHGKLATTQLGRQIFKETLWGVVVSSIFNFAGAMLPLSVAMLFPQMQWIAILIALLMLVLLGVGIASLVYGNAVAWSLSLVLAGVFVAFIGYKLNVV